MNKLSTSVEVHLDPQGRSLANELIVERHEAAKREAAE